MGMFDYIRVETELPDGFVPPPGFQFQTKDLDCTLAEYVITADGRLMLDRVLNFDGEHEIRRTPIEYHGTINFYGSNATSYGGGVYTTQDDAPLVDKEYTAYFIHGVVERIEGGDSKPTESRHVPRSEAAAERAKWQAEFDQTEKGKERRANQEFAAKDRAYAMGTSTQEALTRIKHIVDSAGRSSSPDEWGDAMIDIRKLVNEVLQTRQDLDAELSRWPSYGPTQMKP